MSGVALRSGSGELWMACASFDAEEEIRLTIAKKTIRINYFH